MGTCISFLIQDLITCADLTFDKHGFYSLFFLLFSSSFCLYNLFRLVVLLNNFVTFIRGRSPNLLGSPDRSMVVFCQSLLAIGLHDQWVYPSLSHSPIKMDLDDDDDDDTNTPH